MKYIYYSFLLLTFLNLYSSDHQLPNGRIDYPAPCSFANSKIQYPFKNIKMQKFFGSVNYKDKISIVNFSVQDCARSSFTYALLPIVIEGLVFNPPFLSMLPFIVSNVLNVAVHIIRASYRFDSIMKNMQDSRDFYLADQESMVQYCKLIQSFYGKYGSICECTDNFKILHKKEDTGDSFGFCTEEDYKFQPINIPENIKDKLHEKTALRTRDYFYSALMTVIFTYFASAIFYKSLTAHLNINTFGKMGLTICYNWYLLRSKNKEYQSDAVKSVYKLYENFVIKVHNSQMKMQLNENIKNNKKEPVICINGINNQDYSDDLVALSEKNRTFIQKNRTFIHKRLEQIRNDPKEEHHKKVSQLMEIIQSYFLQAVKIIESDIINAEKVNKDVVNYSIQCRHLNKKLNDYLKEKDDPD